MKADSGGGEPGSAGFVPAKLPAFLAAHFSAALSPEERAALYNDGAGLPYPFTITGGEPVEDFIFADGFDSGNLAAWSSAVTDDGDLAAATQAKYWGPYGLAAQINDTNELYVQDDSPDGETRYHARFYLDPNGLAMGLNEELDVFTGQSGSDAAFRVQLSFDGSEYLVRTGAASDAGGWVDCGRRLRFTLHHRYFAADRLRRTRSRINGGNGASTSFATPCVGFRWHRYLERRSFRRIAPLYNDGQEGP